MIKSSLLAIEDQIKADSRTIVKLRKNLEMLKSQHLQVIVINKSESWCKKHAKYSIKWHTILTKISKKYSIRTV